MTKYELVRLRELVNAQIEKRGMINQYLDNPDVVGYLNLIGECTDKKDLENIREILIEILKDYKVRKTNGIYVCTQAYDEDNSAPILYYFIPEGCSSYDHKVYKDIESGEEIRTDFIYGPNMGAFERSHTVLNPYNVSYKDINIKENGYEDVRLDFFEESYKKGQNSAIQKVLSKYPRMGSREL